MGQYYPRSTDSWIEQAEDLMWHDIENPSVTRLQALLLMLLYRIESEKPAKAFMLTAISARMAVALHLNYENKDMSFVPQEVRRRIVWTLAAMDGYFAIGLPEFEVFTVENIYVQLPCTEELFAAGTAVKTESLRPSGRRHVENLDCLAFVLRAAFLRRDIMRLNRQLALSEHPVSTLEDFMHRFADILSQIETDLNQNYAYSKSALVEAIKAENLPRFISAHLSLRQAFCDLYRILLRGYSEAAPEVVLAGVGNELMQQASEKCWEHVLSSLQIIKDVHDCCKSWILLEVDNAICAYHAARLAIFIPKSNMLRSTIPSRAPLEFANDCLRFVSRFFHSCSFAQPILTELQQLVAQESSPRQEPGTQYSALSYHAINQWNNTNYLLPKEGRKHQRLAIHSLLRRSHFVDDANDVDFSVSSPCSTFHSVGHTNMRI
jgi:hypothetical protein